MWQRIANEKKCKKLFVGFRRDDALKVAIDSARALMDKFRAAHKKPRKNQEKFCINLLVKKGGVLEMVWLESVRFSGNHVIGVPCRDVKFDGRIRKGCEFKSALSNVCDWMYVDNGKLVGGYTIRYLLPCLSGLELIEWDILAPFIIISEEESFLPVNLLLNNIGYGELGFVKKTIRKRSCLVDEIGVIGRYCDNAGTARLLLKPLNYCAEVGSSAMARVLLEAGADPNWVDEVGKSALMAASGRGHGGIMRLLIEWKSKLNNSNELGFTPLFYAVQSGRIECVRMLLENGADMSHLTVYGESVLHYVDSPNIAGFLIQEGALLDVKEKTLKQTPLSCAIERGKADVAVQLILGGCKVGKANLKIARERFDAAQRRLFESAILKAG